MAHVIDYAEKACSVCGETKALDEFYKDKTHSDGRHCACKPCTSAQQKHYRTAAGDVLWRPGAYAKKYGITVEQYDCLLEAQGGVCAICGAAPGKRRLDVDHCHAGTQVRGLLCSHCNTALGGFSDDPGTLRRAADYLELPSLMEAI